MQFTKEKKTEIKVNVYGEEFAMRKPHVCEREELIKILEGAKSQAELFAYQKKFIEGLGLPMKVIDSMEFDHFEELTEMFVKPKKK